MFDNYGSYFLGGRFLENMLHEIERSKQKQANIDAGITNDENHLFGVPEKGIPFKFDSINFVRDLYFCKKDETKTLYDASGCYIFSCEKFEILGENMFLARQNENEKYSLYRNFEKLSKPIYSPTFHTKFEGNFCILNIHDEKTYGSNCVIDKEGNVVLRTTGYTLYLSLTNNIASSGGKYYNLLKGGELICEGNSYDKHLTADDDIFVQVEKCIYKINTLTCEHEIFGTPPPPKPEPQPPTHKAVKEPYRATSPTAPEPGRNDLCPCGSGKKYKHCGLQQKCEKAV